MDYFIAHPIRKFIPHTVDLSKLLMFPATCDPIDGMNKLMNDPDIHYYQNIFNSLTQGLLGKQVDFSRPYIIQIARFDPSKGIPDVLSVYDQVHSQLGLKSPQLIITGHGSIDDPESFLVFKNTMDLINQKYLHICHDIFVIRLEPSDQMLNVLLRKAKIALQLSHREGFEVKVTEAIMKGVPVVAYSVGGITLQIQSGKNGFLVEVGNTKQVAQHVCDLLVDCPLYQRMSEYAALSVDTNYLTPHNAILWLQLILSQKAE